eukprot:TRINITY_DN6402_c0_g2_i1.p1 TRINITY_DN6402_c0_g2~~TRINITY_DN6402_c0_g2_i1.p1  ORF type:complete len:236 (+),score=57.05 TRINITY_DN6402_c0_g2_i1:79-708(+)
MSRLQRLVAPAQRALASRTSQRAAVVAHCVPSINSLSQAQFAAPRRNFASVDELESHDDFKAIRKQYEQKAAAPAAGSADVQKRIQAVINAHPVVVFMKGTPAAPQCGFSSLVCRILEEEGVADFHAVNVLADGAVREGIKQFTSWPTIPQVFVNGEFIGGSDIVKSLFQSGELSALLNKTSAAAASAGSNATSASGSSSSSVNSQQLQ